MSEYAAGDRPDRQAPRRVVVTGAESTGKTRLAQGLAERFGAPLIPEYAREYALAQHRPLLEFDVEPIARGQLAAETAGLLLPGPLLILDTDLLSTAVYARHYYGWCPEWVARASRSRSGLYLLLDIDLPFVSDPTRGPAARRPELQARFQAALTEAGVTWVVVSGAGTARSDAAVQAVERWLTEQDAGRSVPRHLEPEP
jgi:NadR type nicotinamide-nucleotide adenylyltransferase